MYITLSETLYIVKLYVVNSAVLFALLRTLYIWIYIRLYIYIYIYIYIFII